MADIVFKPNSKAQEEFLSSPESDVLFGGASGSGKQIDIHEPVPTPTGWMTLSEIRVGDKVFTEHGEATTVTHVFPIDFSPETYRMVFDDGTEILACADHQWLTFDSKELECLTRRTEKFRERRRAKRPSRATWVRGEYATLSLIERNKKNPPPKLPAPTGTVRTTREIAKTLTVGRNRKNHAIPVAKAVVLPEKSLLIEPYVLGLWLGDGYSATGDIGMTEDDWKDILPNIPREVLRVKRDFRPPRKKVFLTIRFDGLRNDLKQLGLLNNKHIPQEYLRGSIEQRLSLLQGLMDSDGTSSGGKASFTNTNKWLIDGVLELITSLGWKARAVEGVARVNGKDCGAVWDISWTPDDYVFLLPRKRQSQRLGTRRTRKFRYLVSCEKADPVPMRCISVSNPTGLWLVGKNFLVTHNSQVLIIDPIHAGYINHSHYTATYYRETYPQLEQALLPVAKTYYEAAGAKYNEQKKIFTFPSGATIQLGYLQHPDDWRNYQGNEQCGQYFDEVTNIHWENVVMLRAWNRSRADGIPPYRRAASNPGGISHQQCKNYYVDTCPPIKDGEQRWSELGNMWWQPMKAGDTYYHISSNGLVSTRRFIPARIFDNEDLLKNNPEYLQGLLSLPPDRRRALLEGDWNVFEGQFFDLRSDIHVIAPVKEIPDRFPLCGGLDFGRDTRLEVAFRDYEGNIVLFAEHAPKGDTPSERAEELADFLLTNRLYKLLIIYDVTLAQVNDWLGYEKSPLSVFQEVLFARMGDKAPILIAASKKRVEDKRWRVACNEAFKDYLRYRADEHGKLIKRPRFYVTTDCPRFIENVPSLIHDPNSYGGLDYDQKNNPADHEFEAFKMVLMRLRTPDRPQTKEGYKTMDDFMDKEVFSRIYDNAGKVSKSWQRL